jgi:amino acid transporter
MLLVGTTVVYGFKNGFQGLDIGGLSPSLGGFLAVAPVLAFAYVGFEAPNAASEEMFDAANDTAPAIRRGTSIALLAYLLPVLAILLVIPADEVAGVDSFMGAVATVFSIYGSAANGLLTLTALLLVYALLNQGSSWMIATDRIQAMAAADGTFFNGYFGEFNEKLGTPLRVNILSGVMSTVFVVAATLLVEGDAAVLFSVVLFCAISTLLVSYLTIIPALMKLKRIYPDVPRSYQVPGGTRGFHILGSLVMAYIVIGSIVALFPGILESALGMEYDYAEIWGTTQGAVMGFTLGTFAVVVLIGVVGYLGAGKVRKNLAN